MFGNSSCMHTMHIPHNIDVVPPVAEWDCQMMGNDA